MEDAVNGLIDYMVANWGSTLATLAAVGGLSSAFVDILKTYIRPHFHEARLKKFFEPGIPSSLCMATFGRTSFPKSFYLLKRADMVSILHNGSNTVLDFPTEFKGALEPIIGTVDTSIVGLIKELEGLPANKIDTQKHFDLRTKLKRLVENRLDTFNKMTEIRWAAGIYIATLIVSFLVIACATLFAILADISLGKIELILFYWIFGALLAPVAHDLSSALISASKR
ncbi:MAG: hypothetical protein AAF950_06970 [Pseudomonadota bacterium]